MPRVISSSELRTGIKHILNEVGYGQKQYIIERFGEPTAAVISIEDLRLLQTIKEQQAKTSLRETIADMRVRGNNLNADELDALIEEARSDFYNLQNQVTDA